MSVLSNKEIIAAIKAGDIEIDICKDMTPAELKKFYAEYLQPASLDIPIGEHLWVVQQPSTGGGTQLFQRYASETLIDPAILDYPEDVFAPFTMEDTAVIPPKTTVLAHTEWAFKLSGKLAAQISTRSTAKRWGLDVCGSAGWVDPGYNNRLTLEVTNDNRHPIRIKKGVAYGQIYFIRLGEEATDLYEGHYNTVEGKAWTPAHMLPHVLK